MRTDSVHGRLEAAASELSQATASLTAPALADSPPTSRTHRGVLVAAVAIVAAVLATGAIVLSQRSDDAAPVFTDGGGSAPTTPDPNEPNPYPDGIRRVTSKTTGAELSIAVTCVTTFNEAAQRYEATLCVPTAASSEVGRIQSEASRPRDETHEWLDATRHEVDGYWADQVFPVTRSQDNDVLDTRTLDELAVATPGSYPPYVETGQVVAQPGESPKDLAERISRDVLGDDAVTTQVVPLPDGGYEVTLDSSTGSTFVATIRLDPLVGYQFVRLSSPGLGFERSGSNVSSPESGTLTIAGYPSGLIGPEVMIDGMQVGAGETHLELVESSWLQIDLATSDGSVLRYLAPR